MSKYLSMVMAGSAIALAISATAAGATTCALTDISPNALSCTGFFAGNLINGSPSDIAAQKAALLTLGYTWDGNFASIDKISGLSGSKTVDFATLIKGISYVGFHFGNGKGGPGNATAFYKIDGGTGLDVITLAYNASSNAALYATTGGVPEPDAWLLMVAGFGMIGATLRRKSAVFAA